MHPLQNYQNYSQIQLIQQQNDYMKKLNNILEDHKNANKLYQNVGYHYDRTERKTLLIDIHAFAMTDSNTKFKIQLSEPLIIDKQSDIFLEHFTIFDAKANTTNPNMAMVLEIDQFNIQNSFASNIKIGTDSDGNTIYNNIKKNRIIIPNESTAANQTKVQKGKKLNFICTINPSKLRTISGSLTDAGTIDFDNNTITYSTIFGDVTKDTGGRFVLELVIVPRKE